MNIASTVPFPGVIQTAFYSNWGVLVFACLLSTVYCQFLFFTNSLKSTLFLLPKYLQLNHLHMAVLVSYYFVITLVMYGNSHGHSWEEGTGAMKPKFFEFDQEMKAFWHKIRKVIKFRNLL